MRRAALLIGFVIIVIAFGVGVVVYRRVQLALYGAPPHYDTVAPELPAALKDPAMLVFSKTNGYRHSEAIPAANAAIASLA